MRKNYPLFNPEVKAKVKKKERPATESPMSGELQTGRNP